MPSIISAGTTSGTALSLTSDTSGELQIRTNNGATTAATITTGGNVGVGTTSPNAKLDVSGSGQTRLRITSTGTGLFPGLEIKSGAANPFDVSQSSTGDGYIYNGANANIYFSTNAIERARLTSTGNLLIGTTVNTNSSLLTVNGTISETVGGTQYLIASQYDIGTNPNQIPLNQYLGTMAFQNSTALGPITSTSVNSLNTFGFRNRIINGAMVIDQRNAGASVTITDISNLTYTLDRWAAFGSIASRFSVQQNAGAVTPPPGYTNYLGVTSLAATVLAASDQFTISQSVEGFNTADLAWGTANARTVTVSFWVRSSLTGTFGGAFVNAGLSRGYGFTYSISVANTWEQKTVTVAGDTTGTWATNNTTGIRIYWGLGVGSNFPAPVGVWSAGSYRSAVGGTSVVGTNGATWYITGVQLEVGTVATTFDVRPYGTELQLCQRYFQRLRNTAATTRYLATLQAWASTALYGVLARFPVTFRGTPTVSISASFGGFYTATSGANSTAQPLALATDGQSIETGDWPGGSSLTPGQAIVSFWNVNSFMDGSAEL